MTRTIKASEVKPGMEVEWTHAGITRKCVGSVVEPTGTWSGVELHTVEGGAVYIPRDVEVTVLSELAPPKPEEPTEFGARVVVDGRRFLRADGDSLPWVELDVWDWYTWDYLCSLGPVQVVPDQGWTVPAETELTPEVPDRITEWPENDTALRPYPWRDTLGIVWRHGVTGGESGWSCGSGRAWKGLIYGPFTRVTDA